MSSERTGKFRQGSGRKCRHISRSFREREEPYATTSAVHANTLDLSADSAPPCGERAARALCQRVAALRAALDAVRGALPLEDSLTAPVEGARLELDRLARDVRALVDWSLPAAIRPLECTLEEIGLAAVDALDPERRARTVVAVERPDVRVAVDGPVASRSLARILEHGFARGAAQAGLQISPRERGFAATASFDGDGAAEHTVATALADALARRDLARLGARVSDDETARTRTVEFVAVPTLFEAVR